MLCTSGFARRDGRIPQIEAAIGARLLAADGNWPAANSLFEETLERATALGLSLEIARTQAAWGQAALVSSPNAEQGYALIAQARAALTAHGARAELAALTPDLTV